MRQPADTKRPDNLYLCDYCKNNVVIFPVKPLSYEYETRRCFCCQKKQACRPFEMAKEW